MLNGLSDALIIGVAVGETVATPSLAVLQEPPKYAAGAAVRDTRYDSMDVEKAKEETGGRGTARMASGHSAGRGRLVAALVAQSALVLLCLAVSFHSWVTARSSVKDKEKWQQQRATGIYLEWKTDSGESLKFRTHWSQNIELKNQSEINFPCNGPYLMYLDYRAGRQNDQTTNGTLQLVCNEKLLTTFYIKPMSHQKNEAIFIFTKNDVVSVTSNLQLSAVEVQHLHLSFYYMMGAQCFT
ncbi:hypothetical protein GN956_G13980 [Arapaima gigas]